MIYSFFPATTVTPEMDFILSEIAMVWPWAIEQLSPSENGPRHPEGEIPWRFIRSWLSLAPRCRMGITVCHIRNGKTRDQLELPCCFLWPTSVPNQRVVRHRSFKTPEGLHNGTSSTYTQMS